MSILLFWPAAYPAAFTLSASANVSAGATTPTTAQLTAPSGKTAGAHFTAAGRISDDTNPIPAIDISPGKYIELEWVVVAVGAVVVNAEQYEFRVVVNDVPLDTYTVTPTATIASGAAARLPLPVQVGQAVHRASTY